MCSIYITENSLASDFDSKILVNRGPDAFSSIISSDLFISHYLLNMTGKATAQPVRNNNCIFLFNGEIYNYNHDCDYDTDIYKIINSYHEDGTQFCHSLDGEYAIVIINEAKSKVIVATDVFGTKPLYYSEGEGNFSICSYKSVLEKQNKKNISKFKPNSIYEFDLKNKKVLSINHNHSFSLKQHKKSFDDWTEAFLNAIKKRFTSVKWDIVLPLSGGHDSGAIACAFNKLGIKYESYTCIGHEDVEILKRRLAANFEKTKDKEIINIINRLNQDEFSKTKNFLKENTDTFTYGADLDYKKHVHNGFDDPGAIGLTFLLNQAKNKNPNIRICASGQGGDEITTTIQTYKFGKPNPKFFPEDLSSVFPWENLFYGAMSSYLLKEECVTGCFGIESRYPFLDKKVVQEFLSLHHTLKNSMYKAPITNFLLENNYPHSSGNPEIFKKGFNA